MVAKAAFKGGLNLKFFEQQEFESVDNTSPNTHLLVIARNALRLLMMGWPDSWAQLISWPLFKAIFIQRNPLLLKSMRLAFQQGFETLFNQLKNLELTETQNEQVQLYLSNCMSILPISDITPYESIKIPQKINGEWVMVDYHVQPIELTSAKGIKRYFIKDQDRVFAYGLEPISNAQAQPHLIFMGTTYPAGQGFVPQINTDFEGATTVGSSLYRSGRQKIKEWLVKQNKAVHVCGISLGGSLSLLLAIDQGQYIGRVDALNPPGLHEPWGKNEYDGWDKLVIKPTVVIQKQANDPVSIFGLWKKEWEILHVTPPKEKQGPNFFFDHFLNYAGFSDTVFSYITAEEENLKRGQRNFWLFTVGRNLLYYGAIAPYSNLFRPTFNFLYEHAPKWTIGFLFLCSLAAFYVLAPLGIAPIYLLAGSMLAISGGCSLIVAALLLKDRSNWGDPVIDKVENARLHDPKLPRNRELDIYNPANAIDIELTHGQLHSYYRAMRCLVKSKNFIPEHDKPFTYNPTLSKKELLLATECTENHEKPVQLKATKAKAIHIKHTLSLIQQLGIDNDATLKSALKQEYKEYCLGKTAY